MIKPEILREVMLENREEVMHHKVIKRGQRRNSVAELSEDDRQTVHEEWQI